MDKLLELSDITLIPTKNTYRSGKVSDMNFWYTDHADLDEDYATTLPIFTSPMSSVVDSGNWKMWLSKGIKPIIPRTEPLETRLSLCQYTFAAFSLQEVIDNFLMNNQGNWTRQVRVCIDMGNGHEIEVINVAQRLRSMFGKQIILMGGNIANPATYEDYYINFDYVRVGIASGSLVDKDLFCYHYPTASLVLGMREFIKNKFPTGVKGAKIVVDGGISSPQDVVKAIAVGADYVMIGREFAKTLEAAGPIYKKEKDRGTGRETVVEVRNPDISRGVYYRLYQGNTDPEIQAIRAGYSNLGDWKNAVLKISDTKSAWVRVDKTINSWLEDLKIQFQYSFLMSDSTNWDEFKTKVLYGRL